MASSTQDWDEDGEDNFVVLGTSVPDVPEGQPQKKPTTVQDLTARDKQGRRRFHGAFTGGFSAGFFNTVGTKEGFTPSTFISSRSNKGQRSDGRPEDYMDDEDFDEHGIAPRKFATTGSYASEDRKRKLHEDTSSHVNLAQPLRDLITPEQLSIGIKILRKMGWREGQGLGPRVKKKKKKPKRRSQELSSTTADSTVRVYGCALPPEEQDDADSDDFVPDNMSSITFAPKDVCPISLEAKDNVHGLGYQGLDPSLALPSSYISLPDSQPVHSHRAGGKGIQGQAFGVGAFEEEDEDIYAVDNMSRYDITMKPDDEEVDSKFGWTAPRSHGKQVVPVSYVGKLLEGFTLSSQPLQPKKKFSPPVLPRDFKPQHWSRKRRESSNLPGDGQRDKITAIDRGLMLGETPIMDSVFDLVPKEDKSRIEATKQAIAMTKSLTSRASSHLASRFQPAQDAPAPTATESPSGQTSDQSGQADITNTYLAKFKPAEVTLVKSSVDTDTSTKVTGQPDNKTALFQGGLNFQPFRKDPVKQMRYDTYLTSMKQGAPDPYSSVENMHLTEWEKSREREEFSRASKIYRPMSAMMSSRFVRGAMIDDDRVEGPADAEKKTDQAKAAEMKMFGKLTQEEFEWHPDKLLCRRFNVPNPYPESDLVGLPTVKRDKYSVFNFLSFGDYQPEVQEPSATKTEPIEPQSRERTMKPVQSRRAAMASIFKVLDDPDFHQPGCQAVKVSGESTEAEVKDSDKGDKNKDESEAEPDKDLFRAIFKNSDSESSRDESEEEVKNEVSSEGEVKNEVSSEGEDYGNDSEAMRNSKKGVQEGLLKAASGQITEGIFIKEDMPSLNSSAPTTVLGSEVKPRKAWSRWGQKSVFSVLDDLDKDDASVNSRLTSEDPTLSEAVLSRLSPPNSPSQHSQGGEYEVMLPPAMTSATGTVSYKQTSDNSEKIDKADKSRDSEHKHRKEKKKKSKHKKGKKHKKHRKSSKSRKHKEKISSGSEADTETSDVSDSELLQRLKQASHSGALSHVLKKLQP